MTYLLVVFVVLISRYFVLPYSDQPDLLVTIPDYIPIDMRKLIFDLIQNTPPIYPDDPKLQLAFGSVYQSPFRHPSLTLYSISTIPYLILFLGLFLSNNLYPNLPKYFFERSSILLLLLPSTSYYLISVKSEAIINAFSLVFVYNFLPICYLTPYAASFTFKLKKIVPLFIFFLFSYAISSCISQDNQLHIFITTSLLAFLSYFLVPFGKYFQLPTSLSLSLVFSKKTAITVFAIVLTFTFLSLLVFVLPSTYSFISYILPNTSVENVALQAEYYQDVIYKYPYVFRIIILFSSFVFTAASGYSIQFLTKLILLVFIMKCFLQYSRQRLLSQDLNFSLICLLLPLVALAVFPGYATYKYWMFLSPLLLNPVCFRSIKIPVLIILVIYIELIVRAMLSYL